MEFLNSEVGEVLLVIIHVGLTFFSGFFLYNKILTDSKKLFSKRNTKFL